MDRKYFIAKLLSKFSKNQNERMSEYFRKQGMNIGEGCNICSNILPTEPYLVSIGDNTTISTDVLFITHDASVGKIFGKLNASDICGRISIGKNSFIGARSTILYGVSLADDIIVASGSVVTKSFMESKIIIAGNPAKKIGNWPDFADKIKDKTYKLHGVKGLDAKYIVLSEESKLIQR